LADHQRQRAVVDHAFDGFPAQPRIQPVQPLQLLAAQDLHLVGVDDVEVAGQRRPAGVGLDRFEHPGLALLPGQPAQAQALMLLLEQVQGGQALVHRRAQAASAAGVDASSTRRSPANPRAARRRSRNAGLAKRVATSARCCRCSSGRSLVALMAKTRSTGLPSRAPKSSARPRRRKAPREAWKASLRACGIATPWPIAVLPRRSRCCSAAAIAPAEAGDPSESRRAAASRTRVAVPGLSSTTMRSALSRSVQGMRAFRWRQPKLPSRAALAPRWCSVCRLWCLSSRRSSLSTSRSIAAYMSAALASACRARPATLRLASALWLGLSRLKIGRAH